MDQQGQEDMAPYITGSEAHNNHCTLVQTRFFDGLGQYHDTFMLGNDNMTLDNPATGQQQLEPGSAFIDNSQLQPHAQPFQYPSPTREAPRPNGNPYYQNHQVPGPGGFTESDFQFPVFNPPASYRPAQLINLQPLGGPISAPQNAYNHHDYQPGHQPGYQPPQKIRSPLTNENALRLIAALENQQASSQRALPSSQPSQSHHAAQMPGALDDSGPHRGSMPSSPPDGDGPPVSWKRKDIRERNDNTKPENFYKLPFPRVPDWGSNGRSQELGFRYTDAGQWNENISIGENRLKFYLDNCPRKLKAWVQNAPSQANHRTDVQHDRKCRYQNCPTKQKTILAGWIRVAFDEFPQLTSNGKKDPFKVAGSMHLWCFEQCVDPAVYFHKGILKPDTRILRREEKNPMSLERDAGNRDIVSKTFIDWMMNHKHEGTQPITRAHKDSLSFALCLHHVANQTNTRQQSRANRNRRRPAGEQKTMDIHMGDLSKWCRAARMSKNRRARDEPDESDVDAEGEGEGDVQVDDSARDAMQAVASYLPSAAVGSAYSPAAEPRDDLKVEPEYNATSNPLGALTADPEYNTAFDPLGAPPVAPRPTPPGDDLSFLNDNQIIDPELSFPFEDFEMPEGYEMPRFLKENQATVMDGVLTPRSLSCVEDHVEVQKEGSPRSVDSLFGSPTTISPNSKSPTKNSPVGSPTTISPKPKSTTKKRRRSQDDDDECVPTSSPKRQCVPDLRPPIHVEVQKEGSPQSVDNLFGSPTTISPKTKSPTKKRRRSQDDDDEYVPPSLAKRLHVPDLPPPMTRRKSSARSLDSLVRPSNRRTSPRCLRASR